MNTLEIERFSRSNAHTRKIFAGCLASDMLPKMKIKEKNLPRAYVVNLCDSSRTDEFCHWVCIYISKNRVEYFDSSGQKSFVDNRHILRFIQTQKPKTLVFNTRQIQGFKAIVVEFSV